ncbi:MAG: hypothetical protein FJX46_08125 [Alphaproteobacteria bacterium]|nr:hypothetical protein [Alphaproteobacteria bacterium]
MSEAPIDLARLRQQVEGKNIHTETLLATDYLNHFNEIVMLLDMVADMPDMIGDCKAWKPKSYSDHFRDSTFVEKELAIQAYEHAPKAYRQSFDRTVELANEAVAMGVQRLEEAIAKGQPGLIAEVARQSSQRVQKLMDVCGAIIHGRATTLNQAEIDQLMGN